MPGIPVSAGFAIGLAFGVVGLLSGFCLMSSLRDWWTANDGRKVRSYALALAVAILGTQFIAGAGLVDIAKSIYLQPSFSAPLIFAGGLLFGFGMVLSNGCASRALVLLGKGNLRSLVVIAIIGIAAQMTLKGLIAPARLGVLQATQTTPAAVSAPALLGAMGIDEFVARIAVTLIASGALLIFAFSDRQFRRAYGQIAAGLAVGLLVTAGWLTTGWLGADDFNPIPVTSLSCADRGFAAVRDALHRPDAELRHRACCGRSQRQPCDGGCDRALQARRLHLAEPHGALDLRCGFDGHWRRDGLRLLDRSGTDRVVHAGHAVVHRGRRNPRGRRTWHSWRGGYSGAGDAVTRSFTRTFAATSCSPEGAPAFSRRVVGRERQAT